MSELDLRVGVSDEDIENALHHPDTDRIRISPSSPPLDLAGLVTKMRSSACSKIFLELLASEPIGDGVVWRAMLEDPVDTSVAMIALGNATIPQGEVVRLLDHPSSQVQGHALLARLQHQLPQLGEAELNALLDTHEGDGEVSLGVRHLVARSRSTPRRILLRLADDDADFIAQSARRRLEVNRQDS